ncbi:MAG: hypothetical protein IJ386_02215 [Clostridia bacterium]|nr:hypothetical protein [Clostridia bacterium]
MAEAIIYTVFAIFAVYGMYTAARELVLFLQRICGKEQGSRDLCGGCKGCSLGESAETEDHGVPDCTEAKSEEDDEEDRDFFRT